MANLCSCTVTVSGDIKEFVNDIQQQIPYIINKCTWYEEHNGYYGSYIKDAVISDSEMTFYMDVKWTPPFEEMQEVSKDYPGCVFFIHWEEPGLEHYGEVIIQDGSFSITDMNPVEYYEKYDENFRRAKICIEKGTWKDIKKLKNTFKTSFNFYLLEENYVKKIPVKELPLFINHEWYTDDAKKCYKERVATGA